MARARGAEKKAFVGRRRELDAVRKLLESAMAGAGAAVAVTGESGIGKTRLLNELAREAVASGVQVFRGRGSELEQDLPFGLVVEALDEVGIGLDPRILRRLGEDRLAELSAVLPSLAVETREPASRLQVERYRSYYAVRALLEQLSREHPVLLVFDDVQWADQASLELLSHLLRLGVPRSLLAFAYRRQTPRRLVDAIERMARDGSLLTLQLEPLSSDEAAVLVGPEFSGPELTDLLVESGGNPFYLEQLARLGPGRAGGVTKDITGAVDQDGETPAAVVSAVSEELSRLPPDVQRLAEAAAVAGEPFDLDLATEIMGTDGTTARRLIDDLVSAEVVYPTMVPGRFVFRHPVVRRAVYDRAGRGWRLGAHERAARALGARSAPTTTRAHHVLRSGAAVGDTAAAAVLASAGHAAASRAPASAARWFEGALRLLPRDADTAQRLDLTIALAGAYATCGRLVESRETLQSALALAPAHDPALRWQISHMIVRTLQGLGRSDEARPLLDAALATVPRQSVRAAGLTVELAKNQFMQGNRAAAERTAREASVLAKDLGERKLYFSASALYAYTMTLRDGAVGDVRDLVDELSAVVDAVPDEEIDPQLLEALAYLTLAETQVERFDSVIAHGERGLRLCRATGNGALVSDLLNLLAVAHLLQGRLAQARQIAETGVETARLLDNDQALAFLEGTRTWIAALQGDARAALAAGENGVKAADRAPASLFPWHAHICYGLALVELGQPAEGLARIQVAGGPELTAVPPCTRPHWQRAMTMAAIASDDIELGDMIATHIEASPAVLALHMRDGDARYARACVHLARGRVDQAVCIAGEAADAYRRAGVVIEAARAQLFAGRALAQIGETDLAEREFESCHAVFERTGAQRLADLAARELRRLGRRVRRKIRRVSESHDDGRSLSEREMQVARLVAQGRTNRQIADELYVSPKTVEAHLTRVFGKLGLHSRAALAAEIGRMDSSGV